MNRPLRILIVDDDAVDRRICRRALARLDPPPIFIEAETADETERLVSEQPIDCVLLDFRLPDRDGLEVLDRLNARDIEHRIPVVMLTGTDDISVAVDAMQRGASHYAVKDIEGRYQELIPMVVQHALRERELQLASWRDEQALARYRSDLSDLARRLMATEKATTRNLAQILHDQLGQTLTAIRFGFDAVLTSCSAAAEPRAQQQAQRVSALIDQAVREVRQVLVSLRPPLLEEHGLLVALDNEMRVQPLGSDGIALRLEPKPSVEQLRWPADVEYAAFMIAREAIANALQHANPRHVRVSVDGDHRSLRVHVSDDGHGIAGDTARRGHLGIVGMRERALAIGARFALESTAGTGTTVCLEWSAA